MHTISRHALLHGRNEPLQELRTLRAGALTAVRTPGNQRRFRLADVEALLAPGDAA